MGHYDFSMLKDFDDIMTNYFEFGKEYMIGNSFTFNEKYGDNHFLVYKEKEDNFALFICSDNISELIHSTFSESDTKKIIAAVNRNTKFINGIFKQYQLCKDIIFHAREIFKEKD